MIWGQSNQSGHHEISLLFAPHTNYMHKHLSDLFANDTLKWSPAGKKVHKRNGIYFFKNSTQLWEKDNMQNEHEICVWNSMNRNLEIFKDIHSQYKC